MRAITTMTSYLGDWSLRDMLRRRPEEPGFCARGSEVEIVWHGRQFFVEGCWYKLIEFVDG